MQNRRLARRFLEERRGSANQKHESEDGVAAPPATKCMYVCLNQHLVPALDFSTAAKRIQLGVCEARHGARGSKKRRMRRRSRRVVSWFKGAIERSMVVVVLAWARRRGGRAAAPLLTSVSGVLALEPIHTANSKK